MGTPVSFTNKTDRHDITEILLKVVLNTAIWLNDGGIIITVPILSVLELKLVPGRVIDFRYYSPGYSETLLERVDQYPPRQ
jgi:hypothetical protein